jgi:predicted metal-dependent RNase
MDVRTVQGLMGHRDITTTQRYVHYVAEQAKAAVQQAEQRQLARLAKATNRQRQLSSLPVVDANLLCRKEDSNLHGLAPTRT